MSCSVSIQDNMFTASRTTRWFTGRLSSLSAATRRRGHRGRSGQNGHGRSRRNGRGSQRCRLTGRHDARIRRRGRRGQQGRGDGANALLVAATGRCPAGLLWYLDYPVKKRFLLLWHGGGGICIRRRLVLCGKLLVRLYWMAKMKEKVTKQHANKKW